MNQTTTNINEELVARLAQGDQAAMTDVFRLYYSRLFFFTLRVIGNQHDAEDIVQEGLLNFWLSIHEKKVVPDNLQGYLFRIIRNLCISHVRKQNGRDERNGTVIEQFNSDRSDEIYEITVQEEFYHRIYSGFDSLTPIQARIMNLLYQDGLSVQEVAEQLATTENNVRNHKARAVERLKAIVSREVFVLFLFFFKNF